MPTTRPAPTLPGLNSPSVGFDEPFALLGACHDRVSRSLQLLGRLLDHVAQQGADDMARSAANDVLNYFDKAAPHHHDDEERHIVPLLLNSGVLAHQHAAETLLADHAVFRQLWSTLRAALLQLSQNAEGEALLACASDAQAFIALHGPHMRLEDETAYPAAQALLRQRAATDQAHAEALAAMGQEMAERRGAKRPGTPSR